MNYYYSVSDNNYIYSIDNVRINFELKHDALIDFQYYFSNINRIDIIEYPLCFSDFKYKCMMSINYQAGVLRLGYCFNGVSSDDKLKGFLDFNPNKCMNDKQCIHDLEKLRSYCSTYEVTRWDLAVDVPTDRSNLHLKKDRRKYELHEHSYNDRTEYLGVRNAVGRVKIYNKTVESKLDYLLSRIEITCGSLNVYRDKEKFDRILPNVLLLENQQNIILADLKDTEKVLVQLINSSDYPMYYFNQLGRKMKNKLKPYLFQESNMVKYDYACIDKCCQFIKEKIVLY